MSAERHRHPEVEEELREKFRKYISGGLIRLKGKDSAIIQYLLYEGWLREYIRQRFRESGLLVSKGIIVQDENFQAGAHSPECDIILYQGPPICSAEIGTIAVVPATSVKAIVEVEKELKASEELVGKVQRYKRFTPEVFVVTYRLWQPSLGESYENTRLEVEKVLGAKIYPLCYGYGSGSGVAIIGELDRLIEDLIECAMP